MRLAEHLSSSRIRALEGSIKDDVLRELVTLTSTSPEVGFGGDLFE